MNELAERPLLRICIGKYFTSHLGVLPGAMPRSQAQLMQKSLPGKVETKIQGGVMFTYPILDVELVDGNIVALIDPDTVFWRKWHGFLFR